MIKSFAIALALAVGTAAIGLAPGDAQAKRLGAGKPAGMQRQAPPAKGADAPQGTPAQTPAAQPGAPAGAAPGAAAAMPGAAAAQQGAAAAATAGKRSWMGPLAGLAAGIGLAALFSHLGLGEGLANVVMMVLLAVVAVVAIRWLMGRMGRTRRDGGQAGGLQLAGAGAGAGAGPGSVAMGGLGTAPGAGMARQALNTGGLAAGGAAAGLASGAVTGAVTGAEMGAAATAPALPDGMSPADFTRVAKQVFIRMQAANDAGDVEDLRRFTTPELFASLRTDLLERGGATQHTDVVQLDAEVVEVARDDGRDVVSVRFWGLVREQREAGAEPFNELWHLLRPVDGGDWAIAGITPLN